MLGMARVMSWAVLLVTGMFLLWTAYVLAHQSALLPGVCCFHW